MTSKEITSLFKQVVDSWNEHNTDKFLSFCDENVVWTDTGNPHPYKGKKGAAEFYGLWNTGLPDFKLTIRNTIANETSVAAELEFSGTNTGTLKVGDMEIPATNKKVTANKGVCFATFKEGKLTEVHSYPDLAGMMVQLGLMQEHPAGV